MLQRLKIEHLALVEQAELTFGPGLNVITGETGAGKSILVGAIALALGDRAHPDSTNEKAARVDVELRTNNKSTALRRQVQPSGRTKAWINGSPVPISRLKEEAAEWVDLTAQREGATLLDPATHLRHLDRFAGLSSERQALETLHIKWQALRSQIAAVKAKIARSQETEELARFQLDELLKFDPQPGEDEELDNEIMLLEGAESLIVGLSESVDLLEQGDGSILDQLSVVSNRLGELSQIDLSLIGYSESIQNVQDILVDVARELLSHRENVELDPERLEELRDRRGQLSRLMRKYGGSMESVIITLEGLKSRESGQEALLKELAELEKELADHLSMWEHRLSAVSKKRHNKSGEFSKELLGGLQSVGVQHPQFKVAWIEEEGDLIEFPESGKRRVTIYGWDSVEFHVSFNPGQPVKPIQNVASGGELSRIMLLLKGLAPSRQMPPVLVFDEIDTGISGRTARQVGLRLRELAKERQVLLVTHLPQIASLADYHLVVEKQIKNNETEVRVRTIPVGGEEQVEEIARLVGSEKVTDAARNSAKELIGSKK